MHSMFYLPISISNHDKMKDLKDEKKMALQSRFKHVGFFVIDEKSMMGHKLFKLVDKRL